MDRYIHDQNLAHYRRLVAESERDPSRNQVQHNWLLKLLADEEAEDAKPKDRRHIRRPESAMRALPQAAVRPTDKRKSRARGMIRERVAGFEREVV
jgi:hypothetical protein